MRLKPILEVVSYVVAIGAGLGWFLSTLFARSARLKKRLKWLFGIMCLVAIVAAILCSNEETTPAIHTSGPNSPIANVSGIGSGATVTVTQVSGNQTVNNGVSEATMLALLRDKSVAANRELSEHYPYGYVLVGAANGKIVYFPNLKDVPIQTDWNRNSIALDPIQKTVHLEIEYLQVGTTSFRGFGFQWHYIQNQPTPLRIYFHRTPEILVAMYCEVLDETTGVFVLGFK
jgi:hypothetical protein